MGGTPGRHAADRSRDLSPGARWRHRLTHPAVIFGPAFALSLAVTVPMIIGGGVTTAARAQAAAGTASPLVRATGASGATDGSAGGTDTDRAARADRSLRRPPLTVTPRPTHTHKAPTWVRPDVGRVTSGYGYRPSMGDFHPGIDLGGPWGSPIRAAAAGTIIYAGPASGFGQMMKIQHAHGVVTVYGHMEKILVHHGHVRAGQVIAREGSEGHSTGPHLHFEVWVHGKRVNPLTFLRRHGVDI